MKKYLLFLSSALIVVLFSACSTTQPSNKVVKLSNTELAQLEIAAKNTVQNIPDTNVSKAEKVYVVKNAPIFRVRYTGYKRGKYSFTWEINTGKTIQVSGNGNMLNFRNSFKKVSIASLNVVENA